VLPSYMLKVLSMGMYYVLQIIGHIFLNSHFNIRLYILMFFITDLCLFHVLISLKVLNRSTCGDVLLSFLVP
jgi:hypothetical protein